MSGAGFVTMVLCVLPIAISCGNDVSTSAGNHSSGAAGTSGSGGSGDSAGTAGTSESGSENGGNAGNGTLSNGGTSGAASGGAVGSGGGSNITTSVDRSGYWAGTVRQGSKSYGAIAFVEFDRVVWLSLQLAVQQRQSGRICPNALWSASAVQMESTGAVAVPVHDYYFGLYATTAEIDFGSETSAPIVVGSFSASILYCPESVEVVTGSVEQSGGVGTLYRAEILSDLESGSGEINTVGGRDGLWRKLTVVDDVATGTPLLPEPAPAGIPDNAYAIHYAPSEDAAIVTLMRLRANAEAYDASRYRGLAFLGRIGTRSGTTGNRFDADLGFNTQSASTSVSESVPLGWDSEGFDGWNPIVFDLTSLDPSTLRDLANIQVGCFDRDCWFDTFLLY